MSQLDFEKWCDEEAKFTNKLKTYIKRQFREVSTLRERLKK